VRAQTRLDRFKVLLSVVLATNVFDRPSIYSPRNFLGLPRAVLLRV